MIVHQSEPLNAEPSRSLLAQSMLTAVDAFYVRNHGHVPEAPDADWRLRVSGGVRPDIELSLADLQDGRLPRREEVATLQCAGNRREGLIAVRDIPGEAPWGPGATGTARWGGVALRDVLELVGVGSAARYVAFVGRDMTEELDVPEPYGASIPVEKALRDEVMLVWEMNGEPLGALHGGPVRVLVPGYIGARSVKWLDRMELRAEPWDGYFQATGYRLLPPDAEPAPGAGFALGEVAVNAAVLDPEPGAELRAGRHRVRGYAFAGGERHVARVEVSVDGARSWQQAELLEDQGRWAWGMWRAELELRPGPCELIARAWDSAAATQPEHPRTVWNPKGYVNNAWERVHFAVT
jgi:sulfite oxidase